MRRDGLPLVQRALRSAGEGAYYDECEGIEVDLSIDFEPIIGMGQIEIAFRIFRLSPQLGQYGISDLLFHPVLPVNRGAKGAVPLKMT